jgi:hypothetical protein
MDIYIEIEMVFGTWKWYLNYGLDLKIKKYICKAMEIIFLYRVTLKVKPSILYAVEYPNHSS